MKQRADKIKKKESAITTYQSLLCLQNPAQRHVHIVICHCIYTGHYPRIAGTPYHSRNWLSAMSSRSALYKHRNCIFNQTFNKKTTIKNSIKMRRKSNMLPDFDSFCSSRKLQYICNQQERVQRNSQNYHAADIPWKPAVKYKRQKRHVTKWDW